MLIVIYCRVPLYISSFVEVLLPELSNSSQFKPEGGEKRYILLLIVEMRLKWKFDIMFWMTAESYAFILPAPADFSGKVNIGYCSI